MRKTTIISIGVLMVLFFFLLGCAGNLQESQRSYYLQDNFGRSLEAAKYRQTLNPEAGLTAEPVEGLEGRSADMAVDKYRESFEEKVDPQQELRYFRMGN